MSKPDDLVTVQWYCGYYRGKPKWKGDYYEPDECGTTFETQVCREEWDEGLVFATCPTCGAHLDKTYDCPELAEDHPEVAHVQP